MEALKHIFLDNPVATFIAIVMLAYILRGKHWHAMYAYTLVMGAYVVGKTVGVSEFVAGVLVGVIANEIFRFTRVRVERENKNDI